MNLTTEDVSLLIIQEPSELERFSLVESKLLTQQPGFFYNLQKTTSAYRELLLDSTRENRPYQPEYAAIAAGRRFNLWGHSMGAGKTSMALLLIQCLYSPVASKRPGLIHIMVPGVLAAQRWIEDSERIPSLAGQVHLIRTENDLLNTKAPILLYSYDLPKLKSKTLKNSSRPYLSRILGRKYKPALTIVDEIHNVNPGTARYKHVLYLRQRSRRFLGLSGTLSDGNLAQIHNVGYLTYQTLWPYRTAQQFSRTFGNKETIKSHFLGHHRPPESKDSSIQKLSPLKMPEYYGLARRFIHRVRLDDPEVACCIKLPHSEVKVSRLNPTEHQRQEFNQYVAQHKAELEASSRLDGVRYRAQALRLLSPLIRITNAWPEVNPKKEEVLRIVRQSKGKVAIFCDLVSSARCIQTFLKESLEPNSVIRIYARDPNEIPTDLTQDQRVELLSELQFNPTVKVAILSINLTAQSIDLTSVSDVVMYCLPWSSLKVMQALARAVRSGNPHDTVNTHYLYQLGLIDEHKVNLMQQKMRAARLLLDYEEEEDDPQGQELSPAEVIQNLLKGL
jgi:Helicase conserved C-terminal domain/SNF2-related domain